MLTTANMDIIIENVHDSGYLINSTKLVLNFVTKKPVKA
jgi:hypothetical protein